jgi:hypothetical protein
MLADHDPLAAVRQGDFILERIGLRGRHGGSGAPQAGDCPLYPCCGFAIELGCIEISTERYPRKPASSSDLDSQPDLPKLERHLDGVPASTHRVDFLAGGAVAALSLDNCKAGKRGEGRV